MLMVIFGAGASYDSVPSRPAGAPARDNSEKLYRPPLANSLFEDRTNFVRVMDQFPRCKPIIPFLRDSGGEFSVEEVLERLQIEAKESREGQRQLAAIRFYLQLVILETEVNWVSHVAKDITNYNALMGRIERVRKKDEMVCLVTFNYDTLIERILPTVYIKIKGLDDYILDERYKLIKLHGSANWGREIETPITDANKREFSLVANELIDQAPDLKITDNYLMVNWKQKESPYIPVYFDRQEPFFPALAIPVETKQNFECPHKHLEVLEGFIPRVTKLLVIGWRASEIHFSKLLAANLTRGLRGTMVVTGTRDEGREVIGKLQSAGVKENLYLSEHGFTHFVLRELDEFLLS